MRSGRYLSWAKGFSLSPWCGRRKNVGWLVGLVSFVVLGSVIFNSCDENIVDPDEKQCEREHSGTFRFTNSTPQDHIELLIDGISYGLVPPGETHTEKVTALVKHYVEMRYRNGSIACTPCWISIPVCGHQDVFCAGK